MAGSTFLTSALTAGTKVWYVRTMVELTNLELKSLGLLAQGWTYKDIACAMGVAESTVKNLLVHTRRKIGASNACHAVAIALREKLIG